MEMCIESNAIVIDRRRANEILGILKKCKALRKELKIKHINDSVVIPIYSDDIILKCIDSQGVTLNISKHCFEYKYREIIHGIDLRKMLENIVGSRDIGECISSSIDIIGDIALIEVYCRDVLERYREAITQAVIKLNPSVRTIYAKGIVEGMHRVRNIVFIGGEEKTKTIHKEHGILIAVDIAKTYFNPSLSTEHSLVAKELSYARSILDLFTGVGPFALHIAKISNSYIVACDINRDALKLLRESIEMNRLKGYIDILEIDSINFIENRGFIGKFDAIIMNLPHHAYKLICSALEVVKSSGKIYLYIISRNVNEAIDMVNRELYECRAKGVISSYRKVLDYAPRRYIYRIVIENIALHKF